MATPSPAEIQYQLDHISDTKVPGMISSFVISLTTAYIAVCLRLISRRISKTKLQADDWCIILSLIFTTSFVFTELLLIRYGFGRHEVLVTDPIPFGKAILAGEILYNPAILTIKISILLLYKRLFPGASFHRTLWSIGAFVLAYTITQILCGIFQCVPVQAAFDFSVQGRCINLIDVLIICSSFNVATDVVILCLPLPKLWKLKISDKQKLQLISLFLLGGLVCIISIYRLPKVRDVSLVDASWSDVDGAQWSIIECGVGTLSACLPTLRPLFNLLFHSRSPSQARSSAGSVNLGRRSLRRDKAIDNSSGTLSNDRPLGRFEKLTEDEQGWSAYTPLDNLVAKKPAKQRNELPTNAIKVTTDLDQITSNPHT